MRARFTVGVVVTGRVHMRRLILIVAALAAGCSPSPTPESASLTPPFLETPVAPRPQMTAEAAIARGKQVYDANCVQCHGATGQGDGYGAPFLVPAPRDFTAG